jgi:hypothetical protein
MGVFDYLLNEHPAFPWRVAQTHAWDVAEDNYGDAYHLDAEGQFWRLTRNAGMSVKTWEGVRASPYRVEPFERLTYTGWIDAWPEYPEQSRALFLIFRDGRLVRARNAQWYPHVIWPRPRRVSRPTLWRELRHRPMWQ